MPDQAIYLFFCSLLLSRGGMGKIDIHACRDCKRLKLKLLGLFEQVLGSG